MTTINNNKPLVSISCITFNHVNYIEQALNGFLMQKTNFDFEVLIHDDASTDGTEEIIRDFEKRYPSIIKPLYEETNQWQKGRRGSAVFNFPRAQGKYIALCEGDDYWIDPLKLQKQVDFLESNPDYVMCTHVSNEINEVTNKNHFFPLIKENTVKNIDEYIISNHSATCSLLFIAKYFTIPKWYSKINFGDWGLVLTVFYNSNKKMMVLKECMGVYRIHSGSLHGALKNSNITIIKAYKQHLLFFDIIKNELLYEKKYKKQIFKKYSETYKILMNLNKEEKNLYDYYKFKLLSIFYNLKR